MEEAEANAISDHDRHAEHGSEDGRITMSLFEVKCVCPEGGMPQYCRATPTECRPCLGKPVSSTIHQPPSLKSIAGTTHCANTNQRAACAIHMVWFC